MGKNIAVNADYVKKNVKFLFSAAKVKGLVPKLMSIAGIISLRSLRWSYQNGKISQKQVDAYVIVIGVEENLVIGQREITEEDKRSIMKMKLENVNKGNTEIQCNNSDNPYDAYSILIRNCTNEELINIKKRVSILYKKIELRELEDSIK